MAAIKPSRPPILDIANLAISRGSTAILRGIDWRVQPGEHWVILGPNGCGKTSLLKAMMGYFSPTRGTLTVLGKQYGRTDWRELRLKLGIVTSALQASIPPAEPALETVVSGRYAQLDLWAHPTPGELSAARKAMRLLGAAHLAAREWLYLSQGERQRVLIARALMARPKLLILDEPCAGLDPVAREDFLQFMDRVTDHGPSLVLVTHHVEEITPGFTHALVLREGAVLASGPVKTVVTSEVLSEAFGARVKLARHKGRLEARVRL
ncbi:MAG TPA: ABC transporter ATP-binding protein [Opitutaceae bacterium]|jgi:iron complex transport system ATP-binding protein